MLQTAKNWAFWMLLEASLAFFVSGQPQHVKSEDSGGRVDLDRLVEQRRKERADLIFPARKKLIGNGWYNPSPAELADNTASKENVPWDGVVMVLKGGRRPFNPECRPLEDFMEDFEDLADLECRSFTDNFIWMDCTSDIDWFDKLQWQNVLHNTRILARAATLGRCAGILFDPECYGPNPWTYNRQPGRQEKTFATFEARVKECGEEWIREVQKECPRMRILTLFWSGCDYLVLDSYNSTGLDTPLNDRTFSRKITNLRERLADADYALLPSFMNGMLQGIDADGMIVNGNEAAYYYEKRGDYEKYRTFAEKYLPQVFIEPHLQEKYRKVVKLGSSWYTDYYFIDSGNVNDGFGPHLKPDERQMWAEHNIYWAMQYSDEYVWEWTEGTWERPFNWWEGHLPQGYAAAVQSAKAKVLQGRPLGFDSSAIFSPLFNRLREKVPAAVIGKLAEEFNPPHIDGRLDDPAWEKAYLSPPFLPRLDGEFVPCAESTARICCDARTLYIAFDCREPHREKMKMRCRERDGGVCDDDSVQALISAQSDGGFPLYMFAVNAVGTPLDYLCGDLGTWDESYDPEWQYGVSVQEDNWTAEMAIPWHSLKIAPAMSVKLKLNLYRYRFHQHEQSGWAPSIRWGLAPMETDWFGTLVVE